MADDAAERPCGTPDRISSISLPRESLDDAVTPSGSPAHAGPSRPGLRRIKSAMRERDLPLIELGLYLLAYHALLLSLAYAASQLGLYDTSSILLDDSPSVLNHWDAVYFTHMASHGFVYEQEFAFGPLMPWLSKFINSIILSTVFHYIAVVMLYKATLKMTSSERMSKIAAILHIVSPAGIFLCVGYTESLYAALTFSGLAILHTHPFLAAGLFGLSGITRTTGITSAIFFLPKRPEPMRMLRTGIYCAIILMPWLSTQAYAYYLFCPDRPWCKRTPPLIYSFVQDHYWNVGFGRYFTLSNLPLFMLSAPMYTLSFLSLDFSLVSVQQGLLTFVTFTTAHAQIITRMSSAFPRVYWFLAKMLAQDNRPEKWNKVVYFFILYSMIQAVLFGAFLPPA